MDRRASRSLRRYEDRQFGRRDIVERKNGTTNAKVNKQLDKASFTHQSYDPLSYALRFPEVRVGLLPEYAPHDALQLAPISKKRWILLHSFWPLAVQHYFVDRIHTMEAHGLSLLFHNQRTVRAENYIALCGLLVVSGRPHDAFDALWSRPFVFRPSTSPVQMVLTFYFLN